MDFREQYLEKVAVIERIRAYIRPLTQDKRMHIMGDMILREIDRVEKEEAERTLREGRG